MCGGHVPELGTRVDDPDTQGPLPDPFFDHGLLAAVDLHGQPVHGRFEHGVQAGQEGDPRPTVQMAVPALLAIRGGRGQTTLGGRVLRRGITGHSVRAASLADVRIARILRKTRVVRSPVHGAGDRRRRRTRVGHGRRRSTSTNPGGEGDTAAVAVR